MALGGGTFVTQNKRLPGSYINVISKSRASAAMSDRGIAAMPLAMDWGVEGAVFTVTNGEFQKDSLKLFGYPYTAPELAPMRDFFMGIKTAHLYRLNGGVKAENTYCVAKYSGKRGNALKTVVEANENSTEAAPLFDVTTIIDDVTVDIQTGISKMADLKDNDYVTFKSTATLTLTAGTPLTGGTSAEVTNANYQSALDKLEPYSYNSLGCASTDPTVKSLFANFTRRMRDEVGAKFQCVLFRYNTADYEGVISVENGLVSDKNSPMAVYWLTGAEAGCAVNKDLTNHTYTGEFDLDVDYTQADLEAALAAGKLMFHRVGDEVRVLKDINTFTSFTDDKSEDLSLNQVMRVLDQDANDMATLFNDKYNGNVPNDAAGRISLWNDIVTYHMEYQKIRAIENFNSDDVKVEKGQKKTAVVVDLPIEPTAAMNTMYMTIQVI